MVILIVPMHPSTTVDTGHNRQYKHTKDHYTRSLLVAAKPYPLCHSYALKVDPTLVAFSYLCHRRPLTVTPYMACSRVAREYSGTNVMNTSNPNATWSAVSFAMPTKSPT